MHRLAQRKPDVPLEPPKGHEERGITQGADGLSTLVMNADRLVASGSALPPNKSLARDGALF